MFEHEQKTVRELIDAIDIKYPLAGTLTGVAKTAMKKSNNAHTGWRTERGRRTEWGQVLLFGMGSSLAFCLYSLNQATDTRYRQACFLRNLGLRITAFRERKRYCFIPIVLIEIPL